jgi:peptide/nickel transport system substrate-binding protein
MTRRDALRVLGLTAAAAGLHAGAPAAAAPTGEAKIALAAEPNTFDPHLTVGRNTQIFIANVYDGLTARDVQGNLVPALAESWKRLNPTSWQFTLRKGVKFHNGDDFNADCVKFTLDRATNPETKATISSELSTIASTEIVDAFTVNIATKTPDFLLPVRLGELFGLMLSPKHTNAAGKEAIAIKPNGTGPFKLVTWAKNERLVLEANESYWRGAPKVKTIVVRPILEDAARVAALQAGEVDLIAPIPHVRIAELQKNDKLVIKTIAAPRIFHVTIDVRKPPFDNVKVRQALNYAVDVNAILKTLYFGHGTRLATVVDKGALGYDPSVQPYPYDPNKAKALLAEAGFPNGFEVEFDSFTGSIADHSKPAEAIIGYLQKVGIRAKANVFEFSAFGPRRVQNKTAPAVHLQHRQRVPRALVGDPLDDPGRPRHALQERAARRDADQDRSDRRPEEAGAPVQRGAEAPQGRGAVHLPLPGRCGVRDEHEGGLHAAPGRDPVAVPARSEGVRCVDTSRLGWRPRSWSSSESRSFRSS